VIPVSLGVEADKNELLKTTQSPSNLIEAKETEKPEILGDKIMGKVLAGMFVTLVDEISTGT
jgi:hypothetical protein